MELTHAFTGLPVREYDRAYDWYRRLFGRAADMLPKDGEAVWRLFPPASVYLTVDPDTAGAGLLTLAVADLAATVAVLAGRGFEPGELAVSDTGGAPPRIVLRDPDGNRIAVFEDPASSTRPA